MACSEMELAAETAVATGQNPQEEPVAAETALADWLSWQLAMYAIDLPTSEATLALDGS